MRDAGLIVLALRARRQRIALLVVFSFVFLAAAATARLVGSHDGHVEFDRLFQVGGYPLISGMLLIGWLLGRFGMLAAFVMLAGIFSSDRADGSARLIYARPVSPLRVYFVRFAVLSLAAFAISAVLMPLFDLIMLGRWAGPMTFVLIGCYVLTFGSLTFLLSVWTRADVWLALLLALLAMVWHALRRGNLLDGTAPGIREAITVLLPPHGAILEVEQAFAQSLPVPWIAVLFVALYSTLLLVFAAISLQRREV